MGWVAYKSKAERSLHLLNVNEAGQVTRLCGRVRTLPRVGPGTARPIIPLHEAAARFRAESERCSTCGESLIRALKAK